MRCDQCEMLSINGVACHESGCPNSGKTWDADREQWIKYVCCFTCGYPVEVGESCDCQDVSEDIEHCDRCTSAVEEGRIGLCDDCESLEEIDEVEDEETTLDADRITDFE